MFVDTQETPFLHDLSKPGLDALSHILRHKELWPAGFEWNYENCESCAIGLAAKLWAIKCPCSRTVAHSMGMPVYAAVDIFDLGGKWKPKSIDAITPDMVADQIDKYIASR